MLQLIMELTTHDELVMHHGRRIRCKIGGRKVNAKLVAKGDEVYILLRAKNGCAPSWRISSSREPYEEHNRGCEDIELFEEPEPETIEINGEKYNLTDELKEVLDKNKID